MKTRSDLLRELDQLRARLAKLEQAETDQEQIEEALRKERDTAQHYLDIAGVMIVILKTDQTIALINQKGCEILELPEKEILGRNWFDHFIPERERYSVKHEFVRLVSGDIQPIEYYENRVVSASGQEKIMAWRNTTLRDRNGRITGTLSSGEEITERKRAEEAREQLELQLRQAQKMEAVGQLAGGVAHDFNNLLTIILGYASTVLRKVKGGELVDLPEIVVTAVREMQRAAERGASLTGQLLTFSRKRVFTPQVVSPNQILSDMANMVRGSVSDKVQLEIRPGSDVGCIEVDASQIEQALLNLVINANDAMPDGGTLCIETADVRKDEPEMATGIEVQPGAYVMIRVIDTGEGMDESTLRQVFDPFFTTKSVGKGTGLGLSMVYGIVTQAGGHVSVSSQRGKGTTFKLFFPMAEAAPATASKNDSPPWIPGHETILLCEDEPMIRQIVKESLSDAGYTVIDATNGQEAMEWSAARDEPIHLLVTDAIMPEMDGHELATNLRKKHPNLRVLFISGCAPDVIEPKVDLGETTLFLQKPFRTETLLQRVRTLLGEEKA